MGTTLSALAPVLQDRFQHQLTREDKGLVETIFNTVMKHEQLFFLGATHLRALPPAPGPPQRLPAPPAGKPLGHPGPASPQEQKHPEALSLRPH